MAAIRSKNMKPELAVRRLVHALGYRYRLHRKDLPGKPDLVFGRRRQAIFVHGCFWHVHPDPACLDSRRPKSNTSYWNAKLTRNVERDTAQLAELAELGWCVLVVWECETRDPAKLSARLRRFLGP
jgi:DNA mismatch endonuclease, patch repair protein